MKYLNPDNAAAVRAALSQKIRHCADCAPDDLPHIPGFHVDPILWQRNMVDTLPIRIVRVVQHYERGDETEAFLFVRASSVMAYAPISGELGEQDPAIVAGVGRYKHPGDHAIDLSGYRANPNEVHLLDLAPIVSVPRGGLSFALDLLDAMMREGLDCGEIFEDEVRLDDDALAIGDFSIPREAIDGERAVKVNAYGAESLYAVQDRINLRSTTRQLLSEVIDNDDLDTRAKLVALGSTMKVLDGIATDHVLRVMEHCLE